MRDTDATLVELGNRLYLKHRREVQWRLGAYQLPYDATECRQNAAVAVFETFTALGGNADSRADWERLGEAALAKAAPVFLDMALGRGTDYWDMRRRARLNSSKVHMPEFRWGSWGPRTVAIYNTGDLVRGDEAAFPRHSHSSGYGYRDSEEWLGCQRDIPDEPEPEVDAAQVSAALARALRPVDAELLTAVYFDGQKPIDLARRDLEAKGLATSTDNVRRAERAVWKRLSRARKQAAAALGGWREFAEAA